MADDLKMPLTQHLEELRWCLVKLLLAIATGAIIAYNYSEVLFAFLISVAPGTMSATNSTLAAVMARPGPLEPHPQRPPRCGCGTSNVCLAELGVAD